MKSKVLVNTVILILLGVISYGIYVTPRLNHDQVAQELASLQQIVRRSEDASRQLQAIVEVLRNNIAVSQHDAPAQIAMLEDGFLSNAERINRCLKEIDSLAAQVSAIRVAMAKNDLVAVTPAESERGRFADLIESKITDRIELPPKLERLAGEYGVVAMTQDSLEDFLRVLVSVDVLPYGSPEEIPGEVSEDLFELWGLYRTVSGVLTRRRQRVTQEAVAERVEAGDFLDVPMGDEDALAGAQDALRGGRSGAISVSFIQSLNVQRAVFVPFEETPALVRAVENFKNVDKHLWRDIASLTEH